MVSFHDNPEKYDKKVNRQPFEWKNIKKVCVEKKKLKRQKTLYF